MTQVEISTPRRRWAPRPAELPAVFNPLTRARLLAEIVAAYVPLVRVLRRNDLPAMVAAARDTGGRELPAPQDPRATAIRLGFIVNMTLRAFPTDGRCLIQSLVLLRLLAARSIDAKLVIGVSVQDAFAAHAWVVHGDRAVLPSLHFLPITEL